MNKFLISLLLFTSFSVTANTSSWDNADWSLSATLAEGENRENIYNLDSSKFKEMQKKGFIHALQYPVSVTGLLVPFEPLQNFLEADEKNPLRRLVAKLAKKKIGFTDVQGMYDWVGANPYNDEEATGIYNIPYPNGVKPEYPMGVTMMKTSKGVGMTFSCATCHTATLFGKSVMGLTNKRVRANEFFHMAKKSIPLIPSRLFKVSTRATEDERLMFKRTKKNLKSVGAITPQVIGLDTSLPQVALSLSRRKLDEYATKSKFLEKFPRKNALNNFVADSKPAVWWNLKYKTRWLSDGSIVEGNPILTNFLWNEIGRGTDLRELEKWMQKNTESIKELTVAAFSTTAPRWTDFFDVATIDLEVAKRGEKVFKKRCAECHGDYDKAWNLPNASELTAVELLETTLVRYHKKTPVKDVGTDPQRYQGMKHFAKRLNDLKISKWMKTTVKPQKGYVPPPLVGIWARYPYLHNNSIPNLCAFLTRAELRPKKFVQGPSNNPETDFTSECVGYPVGKDIPKSWWKDKDAIFDTTKPGLRNIGHTKAFIDKEGNELLTPNQKRELIVFLKTL